MIVLQNRQPFLVGWKSDLNTLRTLNHCVKLHKRNTSLAKCFGVAVFHFSHDASCFPLVVFVRRSVLGIW